MNKLVEKAIDALQRLPADEQAALAKHILELASEKPADLTADELDAVKAGLDDVKAGRFADPAAVEAIFKRLRSA